METGGAGSPGWGESVGIGTQAPEAAHPPAAERGQDGHTLLVVPSPSHG